MNNKSRNNGKVNGSNDISALYRCSVLCGVADAELIDDRLKHLEKKGCVYFAATQLAKNTKLTHTQYVRLLGCLVKSKISSNRVANEYFLNNTKINDCLKSVLRKFTEIKKGV